MKILKTLIRVTVNDLDSALSFYENLLGIKAQSRFGYPEMKLELATVGDILLIAGSKEVLKPFQDTNGTFLVDSVEEFKNYLEQQGGKIIGRIKDVPTGRNMIVKHPDGAVIEYVEHFKQV
ncbi:VOC family protein [Desulfitobacterium sp.]|uniref:VOC family protein n=1 Tax=Desulfitobacterium sp. TaxID=49981 RepID=UPI002B214872|nr:VOC family protein [Desulfitobacterium sp.]MEA4901044.1 VOC family protein [Desulfitobacterium sp.]